MSLPRPHPLKHQALIYSKVYKPHGNTLLLNTQDIAVLPLQTRAADNAAVSLVDSLDAESFEPAPALVVGEGDAVGHLGDVLRGVELRGSVSDGEVGERGYIVAFNVGEVEVCGEGLGDGGFAAAGGTDDDDDDAEGH